MDNFSFSRNLPQALFYFPEKILTKFRVWNCAGCTKSENRDKLTEKISEGSEPSTYKIFEVKIVQIAQSLKDRSELTKKISEGSEPFDYKIFKVKIVQIA